jgi:hypothetical protein
LRRALITLLASCVTVLAGLATGGAAHAATGTDVVSPTDAVSPTRVVPCGSTTVWLRLWGSLGETCYTGNGTIVVNLRGVNREQILGIHTVCLRTISLVRCARGPRTLTYLPPVAVSAITITTP